ATCWRGIQTYAGWPLRSAGSSLRFPETAAHFESPKLTEWRTSEGDSKLPAKTFRSPVARPLSRPRSALHGVTEPLEWIDSRAAQAQAGPVRCIPAHRGCRKLERVREWSPLAQLHPLRDGLALLEALQVAPLPYGGSP